MALTVKIRADASHFDKTLRGVKGAISGMASIVGTIGKGLAYAGAGIAAAGIAGGFLAIKLAQIGEDGKAAEDRLANIVAQMGLFGDSSDQVSRRLGALADKTALLVGVDDDLILATQAKLATFKELAKTADVVGGAFDRATMAAVDMGAAGFGEATANAVQLGKALNDPIKGVTALARAGITFTAVEKEKIRTLVESNQMLKAQDLVLSAIEKQVGGTAAATAKGTDRIKVAVSQLTEKLGAPFATAVAGMAEGFNAQMPSITMALDKTLKGFSGNAGVAGVLVGKTLGMGVANALSGDYDLFAKAGAVVGEAIKAGVIGGLGSPATDIVRGIGEVVVGGATGKKWGDPETARRLDTFLPAKQSAGDFLSQSADVGPLGDAIRALQSEIKAMNSGGRIDSSTQTLAEMKRIRELAERGLFDNTKVSR